MKDNKSRRYVNDNGIFWYYNDELHREDGPALEDRLGNKAWYQYGLLHHINGPAIEYKDGKKQWYIEGVEYTQEAFNQYLIKKQLKENLQKTLPVGSVKNKHKI